MDYEKLKEVIAKQIKENGREEITGPVLQAVLMAMVDSLGEVYPHTYTEEQKAQARANIDALSDYDGEITKEKLSVDVQAILNDVANKQNITDESLATIAKTIVGAINEVYNGGLKDASIATSKIEDGAITEPKLDTELVNVITSAVQPAELASAIATAVSSYVAKADIVETTGSATDKVMSQHGVTEVINDVANKVAELGLFIDGVNSQLSLTAEDYNLNYHSFNTVGISGITFTLNCNKYLGFGFWLSGKKIDGTTERIGNKQYTAGDFEILCNSSYIDLGISVDSRNTVPAIFSLSFKSKIEEKTDVINQELSKVEDGIEDNTLEINKNRENIEDVSNKVLNRYGLDGMPYRQATWLHNRVGLLGAPVIVNSKITVRFKGSFYDTFDYSVATTNVVVDNIGVNVIEDLSNGWVEKNADYIVKNNLSKYVNIWIRRKDNSNLTIDDISDFIYEIRVIVPNTSSSILDLNPPAQYKEILGNLFRRKTFSPIGNPQLVLAHFSDIHASSENLSRIIEWCASNGINNIIHTGDSVEDKFSDGHEWWENTHGSNIILNCIGNHDASSGNGSIDPNITSEMCFNQFFGDIESWGVTYTSGKCYYYKDFSDEKVRLIVLDYTHFDNEQKLWLQQVLSSSITLGLSVLCASHTTPGEVNAEQCSFTSQSRLSFSDTGAEDAASIISQFQQDGGEFIAMISGHLHCDRLGFLKDYPTQLQIQIDAARTQDAWMDKVRMTGEKSQDLFNIISIDTTEKIIRIIRVGADCDRYMRRTTNICVRYSDYTNQYGHTFSKGIEYEGV